MAGGIGIALILIALVAGGFIAAWLFGWGGFAGVWARNRAGEEAVREGEHPEHTRPTNAAQEHTHFVGSDRD
jgi:hypothetical protein